MTDMTDMRYVLGVCRSIYCGGGIEGRNDFVDILCCNCILFYYVSVCDSEIVERPIQQSTDISTTRECISQILERSSFTCGKSYQCGIPAGMVVGKFLPHSSSNTCYNKAFTPLGPPSPFFLTPHQHGSH